MVSESGEFTQFRLGETKWELISVVPTEDLSELDQDAEWEVGYRSEAEEGGGKRNKEKGKGKGKDRYDRNVDGEMLQ